MAWAQEMKNLAADIKSSHKHRTASINDIKGEAHNILREADEFMGKVSAELKEMAAELKKFLFKSEGERKENFEAMMAEIRAKIKEIKGNVKDLLAKSEETRIADFKALMKDIVDAIDVLKKRTAEIKREAREMIGNYAAERQEAAGYWASLTKKGVAPEAEAGAGEEAVVAPKKRGRKKK